MIDVKKIKHVDYLSLVDRDSFDKELQKSNVHLYVVERSGKKILLSKTHNVVVNQGRYLLLQRLTGVPGTPDYTNQPVHYFAAGDGAAAPCGTPSPESPTDTDLINKVAPAASAPPVGTWYIDISAFLTYETINRFRYSIVLDTTKYPDGTRLNEFGLYGGDGTNFTLFARFTSSDIVISASNIIILDWWITLPVNIS